MLSFLTIIAHLKPYGLWVNVADRFIPLFKAHRSKKALLLRRKRGFVDYWTSYLSKETLVMIGSPRNSARRDSVDIEQQGALIDNEEQHRWVSSAIRRQHATQQAAASFLSSYVSRRFMSGWYATCLSFAVLIHQSSRTYPYPGPPTLTPLLQCYAISYRSDWLRYVVVP